jgi:hypothetical protein
LICGAGVLPARMAGEARRHGWRVVAFTFGDAPGVTDQADRTFPSRLNETGAVLAALQVSVSAPPSKPRTRIARRAVRCHSPGWRRLDDD